MKMKRNAKTPSKPLTRTMPDDEHSLTVSEVAELDRCSDKTVRRAIAAGLLEASRVGPGHRLLRVTREAHARYRKAHRA